MPLGDRQPGPSSSRAKQEYGFIMSTTVDDLSYTPSAEERSRDAAQFVATGRKSWKTLRGGGEAVWPPHLEAALLEALEKYHPETVGSKSDTILGRFPMRNRFISDYIFEATGKRRTPKQVGSRLQQLRDTCKKDKILQLLSHRNTGSSSQSERSVSTSASPSPPPERPHSLSTKQDQIYIKILLQDELWPAPTPTIRLIKMDTNYQPQPIQLSPACPPSGTMSQNRSSRNILPFLSGAVELASSCALLPQSTFVVYVEGSTSPVHSEVATLNCHSSPMQRSGWLYGFDLVPNFWQNLCASRDVTRYTIVQTLKPTHSDPSHEVDGANRSISLVYKFKSGDSSRQGSTNTQPLDFPQYPGSPHGQAIPMASQNPPAPQGYPHWQPPVQPDNADAGWTQLAPRYTNRFDGSLAPQPPASNHMSFGVPYPSHRLPSMSKEVAPSGLCSHADVGSYYNINQGPPSHSYGPEETPHSQHFGYS